MKKILISLFFVLGFQTILAQDKISDAEKNAHLVSLGTSAATKCTYCIPYHISEAKRLGATKEEIKTAILIAADVMKMSTLFYGNEFDLEAFKAMLK